MKAVANSLIGVFWLFMAAARADYVILVSDEKSSFMKIAENIVSRVPRQAEVINLQGNREKAEIFVKNISDKNQNPVIAIGLLAAQTAKKMLSDRPVVFCQVLSYEQLDLVSQSMKGVSALPSFSRQFQVWKQLNPQLKRIAVITGKNMKKSIDEAKAVSESLDVEIVHSIVASDREVSFELNRIANDAQGVWIVPDSSVLSSDVIREIMYIAYRKGLQVLAFSPALLREGALLSATPDEEEVAGSTLEVLDSMLKGNSKVIADITVLKNAHMQIGIKAVERFKIAVPENLKVNISGNP